MSKEEFKALHNLHKQKPLVIQKADKGKSVVITKKNACTSKIKEIICEISKFEQIDIKEDKYDLIYPRVSRPDILYGSPKKH